MKSPQIKPESPWPTPGREHRHDWTRVWPWPVLVVLGCLVLVAARGGLGVLVTSIVVAALVACVAVALAWPLAWCAAHAGSVRGRAAAWAGLVAPLLLPGYLWYAGLSAARGPGTWLGGVLERGPQGLNVGVGQALAVVGVAVHLMPLAGVPLVAGLSALPASALDLVRLEPAGALRRWWLMARLAPGAAWAGFAVVLVVAWGSAVPLHLAQVPTYTIDLWRRMDLATPRDTVGLLLGVAALVGVAGFGALVVAYAAWPARGAAGGSPGAVAQGAGTAPDAPDAGPAGVSAAARVAALLVALGATVLPLAVLALSLRSVALVGQFVRDSGGAVRESLAVAAVVGCVCVLLAAGAWAALARGTRIAAVCVRCGLAAGLTLAFMPGVALGWLVRTASAGLGGAEWLGGAGGAGVWVDDLLATTPVGLVLAHVLRFGGVAVLLGVAAARAEPPGLVELRRSEGAVGLGAWLRLCALPGWRVLAGAGLGAAALSLFEIEAGVMLQSPGTRSLARTLLEHLHTLRDQQLAAGAVVLGGCGLVAALVSAGLVRGVVVPRGEAA